VHKDKVETKKVARDRIRKRIRKKIHGTSEKPRIFVYKSNKYIYVQVINDDDGKILATASTLEKEFRDKNKNTRNLKASQQLGDILATRLKKNKIKQVVFDRGFYPYHGRVKVLAEALRKSGVSF